MQRGDHLSSSRTGYSHHGIYLGDGQVIHYAGYASGPSRSRVEIISLEDFAAGNDIRVAAHPLRVFDAEESVQRACRRIGEDLYSLCLNNCEHFVYWCLYGVHWSNQVAVAGGVAWTVVRYAAAARLVAAATSASAGAKAAVAAGLGAGTATVAVTGGTGAVAAGLVGGMGVVAGATALAPVVIVGGAAAAAADVISELFDW